MGTHDGAEVEFLKSFDVIVVGAGISGLATALGLSRAGVSVLVLECRERIGGRLESVSVASGNADLGATWFWPGESRVRTLAAELGIPVHDQWIAGSALYWGPEGVQRLNDNPLDVPAYRFVNGAASLARAIADELPVGTVRTGMTVRSVLRRGSSVVVRVEDSELLAGRVVIALPPSLALSSGVIAGPDLDDATRAVATAMPVWMGSTVKAVAVYSDPFWRARGLAGAAYCPLAQPLTEIHDMSGPGGVPAMLFGFGSAALGRPAITTSAVVEQLVGLFGEAAGSPLEVVIRDWAAQPATAPPDVNRLTELHLFGSELLRKGHWDHRLFWTSTETSDVAPGHIEGALAAAERTVRAIIGRM